MSRLLGDVSKQKELDIALVLVFSFLVLIELIVLTFGYVVKLISLGLVVWEKHGLPFTPEYIPDFFKIRNSGGEGEADIISWAPNLAHHEIGKQTN